MGADWPPPAELAVELMGVFATTGSYLGIMVLIEWLFRGYPNPSRYSSGVSPGYQQLLAPCNGLVSPSAVRNAMLSRGASATDSGLVEVCRRSITNYNVPNAFIRPPTIARSPVDKARLLVGEDSNGRNRLRLL
jgi:hypothetical protein